MDKNLEAIIQHRQRNFFKDFHDEITSILMARWEADTSPDKPEDFDERHYYALGGMDAPDYSVCADAPEYDSNTVYANRNDYLPDNYSQLSPDEQAEACEVANRKAYKQWIIDTYIPDHEKMCNRLKRNLINQERFMLNSYMDDETSEYFGYTWEEILGLQQEGASIPDEVLNWAIEMSKYAQTDNAFISNSSDAQSFYMAMKNAPNANFQTIAKAFVKKNEEETKYLEDFLDEIDIVEKDVDASIQAIETEKNRSENKIKGLQDEYTHLEEKVDNGSELTENEQAKFENIQENLSEENNIYKNAVKNSTKNFNNYDAKLNEITSKLSEAQGFADVTFEFLSDMGDECHETTNGSRVQYFSDGFISVFPVLILPYLAQNSALILDDKIQITTQAKDSTINLMSETVQDSSSETETITVNTDTSVKNSDEISNIQNQENNEADKTGNKNNSDKNSMVVTETPEDKDNVIEEKTKDKIEDRTQIINETAFDEEGVHVPEYTNYKIKAGKLEDYETSQPDVTVDDNAENDAKTFKQRDKNFKNEGKKLDNQVTKAQKDSDKQTKSIEKLKKTTEKDEEKGNKALEKADVAKLQADSTQNSANESVALAKTQEAISAEHRSHEIDAETSEILANVTSQTDEAIAELNTANAQGEKINAEISSLVRDIENDNANITSLNNEIMSEDVASQREANNSALALSDNSEQQLPISDNQIEETPPTSFDDTQNIVSNQNNQAERTQTNNDKTLNNNLRKSRIPQKEEILSNPDERIHFMSANKTQRDFVGFVAQSDSLSANQGQFMQTDTFASSTLEENVNLQNLDNKNEINTTQVPQTANQENNGNNISNIASPNSYKNKVSQNNGIAPLVSENTVNEGKTGSKTNNHGAAIKTFQTSAQQYRNRAWQKHLRLIQLQTLSKQQILANIQKAAYAQAEANRKKTEVETKKEENNSLQKIGQTTQTVGKITQTAGDSTEKFGNTMADVGQQAITYGSALKDNALALTESATLKHVQGALTVDIGAAETELGGTEITTGTTEETAGGITTATGVTVETSGHITVGSGLALIASVITAPLGIITEAAGWLLTASGISTTVSGSVMTALGVGTQATGAATTTKGVTDTTTGTTITTEASVDEALAKTKEVVGETLVESGDKAVKTGNAVSKTGIGLKYTGLAADEAGSALNATSAFVNGNVSQGLTAIGGMALSAAPYINIGSGIMNQISEVASTGSQALGVVNSNVVQPSTNGNDSKDKKDDKKKAKTSKQKAIEKNKNNRQGYLRTRYSK